MSQFRYGAHVQANGIRQHYLHYGPLGDSDVRLDPVIIVPGITSPAVTWGFVAERLAEHVETYVLDVRGRGLSQAGADLDYGLDAQASDLIAFAEALGLERYSVVGHSMGARIAIRAATSHPRAMARVVLVDPAGFGAGPTGLPRAIALVHRLDPAGQAGHERRGHACVLSHLDRGATGLARAVAAHLR
jgi:N-formylmaleamate deformylase